MKEELSPSQSMSSLSTCSPHRTVPQITNYGMAYVPSFFPGAKSSRPGFNFDLSNVKVHPGERAKLIGAKAYTQGTHIHLAPGQEKLLPHEASHVVQQK
jgi:hypothetical protein